jgi:hypothetical protein
VDRAFAWRQHDAAGVRFFNGKGKNPESVIKMSQRIARKLIHNPCFFHMMKYTRYQ